MIDYPRLRIRQSQLFQISELQRFRNLVAKAPRAIHNPHTLRFEMREIVDRIKNRVAQPALPRRGTHPVEEQRIILLAEATS